MKNIKASLDLKKVMDNLPMAVIVVNKNKLIEHANRIAADYAMKIPEDMIGKTGGEAFNCSHHTDNEKGYGFGEYCKTKCFMRKAVTKSFEDGKERKMVEGSLSFPQHGGKRFLRITSIPFKVKMEDHMLVCLEDLTDLKEAQKNKLEKTKLDTAIETAGGLCHELNQPLQAALGYTELLLAKRDQFAGENETRLLKLKDQILRISVTVNNLSKISEYRNRDYIGDEKIIDVKKSIV